MLGAEGQHVALAGDGLGAQEEGREVIAAGGLWRVVGGLLFFDGGVVVDEDEGVLVVGVRVALGAFVARAEVALEESISAKVKDGSGAGGEVAGLTAGS